MGLRAIEPASQLSLIKYSTVTKPKYDYNSTLSVALRLTDSTDAKRDGHGRPSVAGATDGTERPAFWTSMDGLMSQCHGWQGATATEGKRSATQKPIV